MLKELFVGFEENATVLFDFFLVCVMALTEKDYSKIREELDYCERPIYFFDDDPDGLTAFLLL